MDTTDVLRKLHRNTFLNTARRKISSKFGENIYNRSDEWDILIIIDAARYDIISEIATQYEYIEDVGRIKSRGSSSQEWAYNTFVRDFDKYESDIRDTHYVTDNILSSLVLSDIHEKRFIGGKYIENNIEEAMRKLSDSKIGNKKHLEGFYPVFMKNEGDMGSQGELRDPNILSTQLLDVLDNNPDKTIAHYMIPHIPFFNTDGPKKERVWPDKMININDNLYTSLINNYKQNHNFILDHLEKILTNIPNSYDIIITSDHGNIVGSPLGINCTLGHPEYMILPNGLRDPPWIQVDQSNL